MTAQAAGVMMQASDIQTLFTGPSGAYLCARWARPIVPVVFGLEMETLAVVKGAVEAVVALAGHKMAETDPEMGANLMLFFFRDWDELLALPDLDRLADNLSDRVAQIKAAGANQYRLFRFEADGAIRACLSFVRIDDALAAQPADALALAQAVAMILTWGEGAFGRRGALAEVQGQAVLRPEVAAVIRAAYDPVLPGCARDATHALRLAARIAAAA